MAVVLDDLPPLMWHAELGRGLVDVWTGTHHRGVQLHDLRAAVEQWTGRYEQRAWLRQLDADGHRRRWRRRVLTHDRPDGRHAVPRDGRAGRPLGPRPGASTRAGRDDVLRGGRRRDVPGDGAARRRPADELLRPRQLLVRRRARAARAAPASATRSASASDPAGAGGSGAGQDLAVQHAEPAVVLRGPAPPAGGDRGQLLSASRGRARRPAGRGRSRRSGRPTGRPTRPGRSGVA